MAGFEGAASLRLGGEVWRYRAGGRWYGGVVVVVVVVGVVVVLNILALAPVEATVNRRMLVGTALLIGRTDPVLWACHRAVVTRRDFIIVCQVKDLVMPTGLTSGRNKSEKRRKYEVKINSKP